MEAGNIVKAMKNMELDDEASLLCARLSYFASQPDPSTDAEVMQRVQEVAEIGDAINAKYPDWDRALEHATETDRALEHATETDRALEHSTETKKQEGAAHKSAWSAWGPSLVLAAVTVVTTILSEF